ncbi:hypothetical protein E0H93_17625 [Rhizobium leguminosarum bv. viciae]|uniref:hypothetical protein n=1 Tax=Rhizobium leguminosarum TaxID=384 RepID=UPI00103C36C8|nr:hypothetical protein [Rhizobium leguminosarum]TCB05140.1 hypothetical protein E0H93_17625 [Rhizobium leguminosarum bv. viciae]
MGNWFAGNDTPYNKSNTLLSVGLGLLSGKTAQDQVGQAASNFANERQMGRTYNKTLEFLKQNNPDLAQAVESGALPVGDAYKMFYQSKLKADKPLSFQTLPDGTYGFADPDTGTFKPLGNAAKPAGAGGGEYGLNVIYGTDPQTGETVLGQVGKDGSFHRVDTGGFKPVGNTTQQNLGTTYVTRDKAGNIIGTAPIDNSGKALDEAGGKNLAANRQAFPQVEAAADQLLSSIDSLSTDKYLPSMVGPYAGKWAPNVTADANRVQSKMDQIGGQTFLQAFNMLRGAGQITEIEGQKATDAMARLNTAQKFEDYKAALDELKQIVLTAKTRARSQAGIGDAGVGGPIGGNAGGLNWRVK